VKSEPSKTPYTDRIEKQRHSRNSVLMFMRNLEVNLRDADMELAKLRESIALTQQAQATAAKRREARGMKLRTRKGA